MDRGLHELLGTFHPRILQIAAKLHDLVYQLCPDVNMDANVRLKLLHYRLPAEAKPFCSVELHKGVVKLYFMQGDLLDDPEYLLKGSGKWRRIILHSAAQAGTSAVRALVCQAVRLQPSLGGTFPDAGQAGSRPAGTQGNEDDGNARVR